jgi:DNA-directed RNA polymerase specialized sigma24 family protein
MPQFSKDLTDRQKQCVDAFYIFLKEEKRAPSMKEIGELTGLGTGQVHSGLFGALHKQELPELRQHLALHSRTAVPAVDSGRRAYRRKRRLATTSQPKEQRQPKEQKTSGVNGAVSRTLCRAAETLERDENLKGACELYRLALELREAEGGAS